MKEADLQVKVADYIRLKYPRAMFHSDFGPGIKMTKGQAIKQKRQNGGRRGWPDMFIAEPRWVKVADTKYGDEEQECYGLFLELKREGTRLFKKDGSPASPHIAEQEEVMRGLHERGYEVSFVVGFDEAKKVIDEYLKGEKL